MSVAIYKGELVDYNKHKNELEKQPIKVTIYGNDKDELLINVIKYLKGKSTTERSIEYKKKVSMSDYESDEEEIKHNNKSNKSQRKVSMSDYESDDEEPPKKSSVDTKKFKHTSNPKRKVPKTTNRGTTGWHHFVSEHYDEVKRKYGLKHSKDIIKKLSTMWKSKKGKQLVKI